MSKIRFSFFFMLRFKCLRTAGDGDLNSLTSSFPSFFLFLAVAFLRTNMACILFVIAKLHSQRW